MRESRQADERSALLFEDDVFDLVHSRLFAVEAEQPGNTKERIIQEAKAEALREVFHQILKLPTALLPPAGRTVYVSPTA